MPWRSLAPLAEWAMSVTNHIERVASHLKWNGCHLYLQHSPPPPPPPPVAPLFGTNLDVCVWGGGCCVGLASQIPIGVTIHMLGLPPPPPPLNKPYRTSRIALEEWIGWHLYLQQSHPTNPCIPNPDRRDNSHAGANPPPPPPPPSYTHTTRNHCTRHIFFYYLIIVHSNIQISQNTSRFTMWS